MLAIGGRIPTDLQLEPGRALAFLGDGGWGGMVRDQRADGSYSDELVDALVRLVRGWDPAPRPKWVTAVPSRRAPSLVPSLAERVAAGLGLPYRAALELVHDTAPQARMENSAQQHANVAGAFAAIDPVPSGPVLLVDDVVDSRWTLTEAGAMLRAAGTETVLPLALAQGAGD